METAKLFQKGLEYETRRIKTFKEFTTDKKSHQNIILFNSYINKFQYLNSLNSNKNELLDVYKNILDIFSKSINNINSIMSIIWVLSIGIMIDKNNTILKKISKQLLNKDSAIVRTLCNYIISNEVQYDNNIKDLNPYKYLKNIFNAHDKDKQIDHLIIYLKTKWYNGHSDAYWYNSHLSKEGTYSGYWSYESGAIAKMLKLNDSTLKNVSYYPYNLMSLT